MVVEGYRVEHHTVHGLGQRARWARWATGPGGLGGPQLEMSTARGTGPGAIVGIVHDPGHRARWTQGAIVGTVHSPGQEATAGSQSESITLGEARLTRILIPPQRNNNQLPNYIVLVYIYIYVISKQVILLWVIHYSQIQL